MTQDEIGKILEMSGIELAVMDSLGEPGPLSRLEMVYLFHIMTRDDLSKQDKALMMAGVVHEGIRV